MLLREIFCVCLRYFNSCHLFSLPLNFRKIAYWLIYMFGTFMNITDLKVVHNGFISLVIMSSLLSQVKYFLCG